MDTQSQNKNTVEDEVVSKKDDTHINRSRIKVLLLFLGIALALSSVLLYVTPNKNSAPDTNVIELPVTNETERADDVGERTLVGNIIEYQEDESYIRFAVAGENIYSIHVTPATVITEGETIIGVVPVDPLMETKVVVHPVDETSKYDYEGVSIHIKTLSDLSAEERAVRLQVVDSMFVE